MLLIFQWTFFIKSICTARGNHGYSQQYSNPELSSINFELSDLVFKKTTLNHQISVNEQIKKDIAREINRLEGEINALQNSNDRSNKLQGLKKDLGIKRGNLTIYGTTLNKQNHELKEVMDCITAKQNLFHEIQRNLQR